VDDGFGGVWKTIRDGGPATSGTLRYAGSATHRDPPAASRARPAISRAGATTGAAR
jgi:hypothetical protein